MRKPFAVVVLALILFPRGSAHALATKALEQCQHSRWSVPEGLPTSEVRALVDRTGGGIWVATSGGLARLVNDKVEAIPTAAGFERVKDVIAMAVDAQGTLWMAPSLGQPVCLRQERKGDKLDERLVDCLLADDRIRDDAPLVDLHADKKGGVWFSTRDLVYLYREQSLSWTSSYPRDTAGAIQAIHAGSGDRLWLATERGLYLRPPSGTIASQTLPPQATFAPITAVSEGRGGSLLLGGRGALAISGPTGTRVAREADGLPAAPITTLLEDRHANVWAGTSAGLIKWNAQSPRPEVFTQSQTLLPDAHITALLEDGAGALWIGTKTGGVVRLTDAKPGFFSSLRRRLLGGALVIVVIAAAVAQLRNRKLRQPPI